MDLDRLKQTLDGIMRQSQERSAERGERLAERFIPSVLPAGRDDRGHLERRGSCVLAHIEEYQFAFTACHVLNDGDLRLHAAAAPRGKLTRLAYRHVFGAAATDLDVAVLPLRRSQLGTFKSSVFLGLENASTDYSRERVLKMIQTQNDIYYWTFLFLAANQDAIDEGSKIGIGAQQSLDFQATRDGIRAGTMALSKAVSKLRSTGSAQFTDEDRQRAGTSSSSKKRRKVH